MSTEPAAAPASLLKDWIERSSIGKTTAYALLRALGITPKKARIPGVSALVSVITAEQMAALDEAVASRCSVAAIAEDPTRPKAVLESWKKAQAETEAIFLAALDALKGSSADQGFAPFTDPPGEQAVAEPKPESEQREPPSHDQVLKRLEAIERAQRSGAPLSTEEAAWMLAIPTKTLLRSDSRVVRRGRITARRQTQGTWTLDPNTWWAMDPSPTRTDAN